MPRRHNDEHGCGATVIFFFLRNCVTEESSEKRVDEWITHRIGGGY
jgi:hypothetical protein